MLRQQIVAVRLFSTKPTAKPKNPNFGSGPCSKRPGWTLDALKGAALGRSHRSKLGKNKLKESIDLTKKVLNVPKDYRVGIMAGSDTGAFEAAMWTMLGPKAIDVFQWESFGAGWQSDIEKQLKLGNNTKVHSAPYGELPDMSKARKDADVVFTWNGTTSGVCVPNGDWIASDRTGLTMCDATSAAFAMDLPWEKLDVTTFSWQKVLGGEGAHGMLILSPRAVERLESYKPSWPLPKLFRMTKNGKLMEDIFEGSTINTPSMLCVEDYIDALKWAEKQGSVNGLKAASQRNLDVVKNWVKKSNWAQFLAKKPEITSSTSICLTAKGVDGKQVKSMVSLLEKEGVAYDIGAYRDAPDGLRIWGGATVTEEDMKLLMPWLDWAYAEVTKKA
jgi:phosphoserine aminotransferase